MQEVLNVAQDQDAQATEAEELNAFGNDGVRLGLDGDNSQDLCLQCV